MAYCETLPRRGIALRRFMNVTRGPRNRFSVLMFVMGGDAPRRRVHQRVDGRAGEEGHPAAAQARR